ncbi:squalene--hopene cyclase [Roseospira marina]|uniref:Squalene--hopene cyclase n=1 Tax=Roseospira marina TaxID=140057 RepID=A0A5M6IE41_9PROT|nr:squalene--hopene cyclase [Roseospira marina]KAA5606513.1 squalene--hopene cyclase [Roseospira marina]MBB4314064.1 squalene-hopene/tetraprenyl-beta-curcumene cyclase [Roseospira marina]MBB5087225.1 squalene-hopene/tetraprenyl-beta-curcumene cyclase [Roseospira marina]
MNQALHKTPVIDLDSQTSFSSSGSPPFDRRTSVDTDAANDGGADPAEAAAPPDGAPHGAPDKSVDATPDGAVDPAAVDRVIDEASDWLRTHQKGDGHWVFELEADATIPSEYILLNHFLDEINDPLERRIAVYLRRIQAAHGGWPLFHDGDFDMSASVKAYFALKLVGDAPDEPHMVRAREAILKRGGAARCNVFTRYTLAMFGQVPWRACPVARVEAALLPRWFPFHMDKVSYWARTVMMPLFVLYSRRARAENPRGVDIRELFVTPPEKERRYHSNPTGHWIGSAFLRVDAVARLLEPLFPAAVERRATERVLRFVTERLNGVDGLGAIFPAMANTLMMFHILGYEKSHPQVRMARKAMDGLVIEKGDHAYVQPCLSPVWDTGLASMALTEVDAQAHGDGATSGSRESAVAGACAWLRDKQVLDVEGDYAATRPGVRPGGWAFQYNNDFYPDVDDTAVIGMLLDRARLPQNKEAIERAAEWILGLQSKNGGWGAFDADNEYYILNNIPFADHGALLDPPTVDVSARCIGFLAQIGYDRDHPAIARGLAYLKKEQEPDGSWFGRWGTNYIYGTWSALAAFNATGEDPQAPHIRAAVAWLHRRQQADGGWGEGCESYWTDKRDFVKASTPTQTAWAVLALMAAGEVDSPEVRRGIAYLSKAPRTGGLWDEKLYNAVGFPRVFYLKYHGYPAFFPLWAMARYRNLTRGNSGQVSWGL